MLLWLGLSILLAGRVTPTPKVAVRPPYTLDFIFKLNAECPDEAVIHWGIEEKDQRIDIPSSICEEGALKITHTFRSSRRRRVWLTFYSEGTEIGLSNVLPDVLP